MRLYRHPASAGAIMVTSVTHIRGDERPSEVLRGMQDIGRAPLDALLVRVVFAFDPSKEWPHDPDGAYAALTFFSNDRDWFDSPVPVGQVSADAIAWFEGLPFPYGPLGTTLEASTLVKMPQH
jgi:hypothetical protein